MNRDYGVNTFSFQAPHMLRFLVAASGLLLSFLGATQVSAVTLTVHTPAIPNRNVYVAGSFNHWTANDSLYKMHKLNDSTHTIVLPVYQNKTYKYKYTLGHWDEVEISLVDSNVKDRSFVSVKRKKKIVDVVQKWQVPKNTQQTNPQLVKIMAMKDSVLAGLQPKLKDMVVLLKEYIINLLQEVPDEGIDRKITAGIVNHFADAYGRINGLCHKIAGDLTKEQKQMILKAVNSPEGDKDVINTFLRAYGEAMREGPGNAVKKAN